MSITFPDFDDEAPDPECPWCGAPALGTCTCSLAGPNYNPLFVSAGRSPAEGVKKRTLQGRMKYGSKASFGGYGRY